MSFYPPGVTGGEFEIQGPDSEEEGDEYCSTCERITHGLIQTYRDDRWFVCEVCEFVTDLPYDFTMEE